MLIKVKNLTKIAFIFSIFIFILFPFKVFANQIDSTDFDTFIQYYEQRSQNNQNATLATLKSLGAYYDVNDKKVYILKQKYSEKGFEGYETYATYTEEEALKLYIFDGKLIDKNSDYKTFTDNEVDKLIEQITKKSGKSLFETLKIDSYKNELKQELEKLKEERKNNPQNSNEQTNLLDVYDNKTTISSDTLNFSNGDKVQINSVTEDEDLETGEEGFFTNIIGSIGNKIIKFVVNCTTSLVDSLINVMQDAFLPGTFPAVEVLPTNEFNLAYYKNIVGSEAAILFGEKKDPTNYSYGTSMDVKTRTQTPIAVPHIYYGISAILTNNVPAFDINFFQNSQDLSNPIFAGESKEDYVSKANLMYRTQRDIYYDSVLTQEVKDKIDEVYQKAVDSEKSSSVAILRPIISKWYVSLRNFVVLFLLIELVYIGIRMMLSAASKDKAKYKEMFMGWIKAVLILALLIIFMIVAVKFVDILVKSFGNVYNPKSRDYLLNFLRTTIAVESVRGHYANQFGLTVIYFIIICMTVYFTYVYFKRMMYMAVLTLMAPVVTLSYAIDVIGDSKAQAFEKWFHEYLYQLILQPLQLIAYIVFVSTAIDIAISGTFTGIILACIALTFVTRTETFLKQLFHAATMTNNEPLKEFENMANNAQRGLNDITGNAATYLALSTEKKKSELAGLLAMQGSDAGISGSKNPKMSKQVQKQEQKSEMMNTSYDLIGLNQNIPQPEIRQKQSQEKQALSSDYGKPLSGIRFKLVPQSNDNDNVQVFLAQDEQTNTPVENLTKNQQTQIKKSLERLSKSQKFAYMFGKTYKIGSTKFKVVGKNIYIEESKNQNEIIAAYKHVLKDDWQSTYLKDNYNLDDKDIENIKKLAKEIEEKLEKDDIIGKLQIDNSIDYIANSYILSKINTSHNKTKQMQNCINSLNKAVSQMNNLSNLTLNKANSNINEVEDLLEKIDDQVDRISGKQNNTEEISNEQFQNNQETLDKDEKNKLDEIVKDKINQDVLEEKQKAQKANSNAKEQIKEIKDTPDMSILKEKKKSPLEQLSKLTWNQEASKLSDVTIKVKEKDGVKTYHMQLPTELAKQVLSVYKKSIEHKNETETPIILTNSNQNEDNKLNSKKVEPLDVKQKLKDNQDNINLLNEKNIDSDNI